MTHKFYLLTIYVIFAIIVVWSMLFIHNSSFEISDVRYYSLFDDAMISMKYAWNLVNGNGLTWSNGERVEGYTNPLWTLLMTIPIALFNLRWAVFTIQILGIAIVVGVGIIGLRLIGEMEYPSDNLKRVSKVLYLILIFSFYPFLFWTLMGMETGLITLLNLISTLLVFGYIKTGDNKTKILLQTSLILTYFTRPDTLYISILIIGLCVFYQGFSKSKSIIFTYFGFVILHLVFRMAYYGELVPNTVVLKVFGMPLINRIKNGISFVDPFIEESVPLIILIFSTVLNRINRNKIILFIFVISTYIYQVIAGGDAWNYWRFFVPIMPFVYVLVVGEIAYLINLLTSKKTPFFIGVYILTFLIVFGIIYRSNYRFIDQITFEEQPFTVEYNKSNVDYALKLKEISKSHATVGLVWAGSIPYYSERNGIDFLGKNDKYIAKLKPETSGAIGGYGMNSLPGHNKFDLKYSILQLQPDFIERADWANQSVYDSDDFHYQKVKYKNIEFLVKEGSTRVKWDKIR